MNVRKVLIYRAGLLGDTLAAIPALHCLRNAYPSSKIIYIWQKYAQDDFVSAKDVLANSGLVDYFLCDEVHKNPIKRGISCFRLWLKLVTQRIDLGICLEENHWPKRRKTFLKLCGVKRVLGPSGEGEQIERDADGRVLRSTHISDSLIKILRPLAIPLPLPLQGNVRIKISNVEKVKVDQWILDHGLINQTKKLIAIAPWSNMPLKRWPLSNYVLVVKNLMDEFGVTPIVFGGKSDREVGMDLVSQWGDGVAAAGELNVRQGIELLTRCKLYLGNDTGTMHMAAVAGIPCVAIFSARDMVGKWEPYGNHHSIYRNRVACEGCMLRVCDENQMKCITGVMPKDVLSACKQILTGSLNRKP